MKRNFKSLEEYINEHLSEATEETAFTEDQKTKIKEFVKNYQGDFKDEDIHAFADGLGLDKHEVEEFIYGIARDALK